MKEIRKIEEIIKKAKEGINTNLEEAGVNCTLYWAYRNSKEIGLKTIDFREVIWERDIEPIVTTLREAGYDSFTISGNFSGLLDTLWRLRDYGCRIGDLKKVEQRYTTYNRETKQDERAKEVGIEIWL